MHEMPRPNRRIDGRTSTSSVDRRDQGRRLRERRQPGVGVHRDAGVPQERAGHEQGPDDEERPSAEPPGHRAEAGRQERQADPHRDADGTRGKGGVAQHVLEQDALVAERDIQGAIDEERGEIDRRERPGAEQRKRHERIAAPGHQDREGDQGDGPDRDRDPREGVLPVVLGAADEAERQAADRQGGHRRTEPVEPSGLRVPRFLDVPEDHPQGDGEHRDIDEEHGPPPDGVDEQPTDERSQQAQRRTWPTPRCRTPGHVRRPRRRSG